MSSENQTPDPGGSQQHSIRELSDLKDQNEQQLVLIAQLKEMLRKSDQQSNVTEDKVEVYVNTLSRKAKKKSKSKTDESNAEVSSGNIDSNKKERLNLLKQKMEENKAKLAERGKSQKGLEEMVTQLTVQFNDSQQLISQSPLNLSLAETKSLEYSKTSSQEELYNILLTKEKKITELTNKVLDLQENVKEKDSVIDARTKAITLMTESLSKKGKNTLDQLEETKEQMRKMQENFITIEQEMKARQLKLLDDLKMKNNEILDLQEINANLEKERDNLKTELDSNIKLLEEYKNIETTNVKEEVSPTRSNKKNKKGKQQKSKQDTESTEDSRLKTENEELLAKNKTLLEENNDISSRNKSLIEDNENLSSKLKELELELNSKIEELNNKNKPTLFDASSNEESEEIAKLKKQLEESNKSMIKIKAQHKSKVKELTKKLDTFKKMSDANALILQLQNENSKLSHKIAELEDEKGNMQLKMVESTESIKESKPEDVDKLNEREQLILSLENDNQLLKEDIAKLNDKLNTQLQSEQVKSEISNIQVEEKLDALENEKKLILSEKEQLEKDYSELQEKFSTATKENAELSTKLENYIQENMELIDKLEKLSAEKVSSAESIEIVEGLTQQEKLELAAYQKNMEIPADLKWGKEDALEISEEVNLEPPEELNESVLQLNEDSTELLQKIEMFNVERKEVMLKLDALKEENAKLTEELNEFEKIKEENGKLALKLKEIENNRDVLEETYEQLQTEKEEIEKEKEDLEKKIRSLERGEGASSDVESKLNEMQEKCEKLLEENNELKKSLKEATERVFEKETDLTNKLKAAQSEVVEFEVKIKTYLEEIENYKTIIEENMGELIHSSTVINELQVKVGEKEKEIVADKEEVNNLNALIVDLNQAIHNLETVQNDTNTENDVRMKEKFELMEKELDDLKHALNLQIDQAQEYETELKQSSETIEKLNQDLRELNTRLLENQELVQMKDAEIEKLAQDMSNKEATIRSLEKTIQENNADLVKKLDVIQNLQVVIGEKDSKFNNLTTELTEKFLHLQQQLESNNGTMEARIIELQNKNKEQLDKMKKIAANLKKKNLEYKELEEKYKLEKEKDVGSEEIKHLKELLEKTRSENEENSRNYQTEKNLKEDLENKNVELQNIIMKLKEEKSKEKENVLSLKQEFSGLNMEEPFNSESQDTKEMKIKELEMIIEDQEKELKKYEERITRLEEGILALEERRQSLEKTNVELGDKLNETSASFEEKSYEEEQLEQRLASLLEKDDALTKKLESSTLDNEELTMKNQELSEEQSKLIEQVHILQNQLADYSLLQNSVQELETANNELIKQVQSLENQLKENELLLQKNNSDLDKYENDLQMQFNELLDSKNEISVKNEKLEEKIIELSEKNNELQSLLEDNKEQAEESKREFNNKIEEISQKYSTTQDELNLLKTQENVLNKQIEELQKELLSKTASVAVEEIISEATSQVASRETSPEHKTKETGEENITTFKWFDNASQQKDNAADWFNTSTAQPSDWFNVQEQEAIKKQEVEQVSAEKPVDDNSKEELLKKIKTLEFMLYSVEKAKDDALLQCHEMSNELTRLVFERENKETVVKENISNAQNVPQVSLGGLEAQILSGADIVDNADTRKELQGLEFEPVRPFGVEEAASAVVEEGFTKKEAYKCFEDDNEVIQQKKVAPTGNQSAAVSMDAFIDGNDDGWGWGPEEAKLEEEHIQKTENLPQVAALKTQVDAQNEQLKTLQSERDNHLEEIKQLQQKMSKVVKKYKELKHKFDQMSQNRPETKTSPKDSMDSAIEELLTSQVEKLEKDLKEAVTELEKERKEKAAVAKKVDVLTNANEKMVELKEKQDIELLNIQRKNQELLQKLETYEWEHDDFKKEQPAEKIKENLSEDDGGYKQKYEESKKQVQELTDTMKDIMMDNDELESLLQKQIALKNEAETKLKNLTAAQGNVKSEEEFILLLNQKNELEQQLLNLRETTKTLDEYTELEGSLKQLEENYANILSEKNDVQSKYTTLEGNYMNIFGEKNELEEKLKYLEGVLKELKDKMKDLNDKSKILQNEYDNLQEKSREGDAASDEVIILKDKLKDLENQNKELWSQNTINAQLIEEMEVKIKLHEDTIREMSKLAEENVGIQDYQALNQKLTNVEVERSELLDFKRRMENFIEGKTIMSESEVNQLKEEFLKQFESLTEKHSPVKHGESQHLTEIANLRTQLSVLQEENRLLNEKLTEKQDLRSQIFGSDNASENWIEVARLQQQITNLNENLQKLQQENSNLSKKLSEKTSENVESAQLMEIVALQHEVTTLQQENYFLNQKLTSNGSEADRLQLSSLSENLQQLQLENNVLKEKLAQRVVSNTEKAGLQVSSLDDNLQQLQEENNILKEKLARLQELKDKGGPENMTLVGLQHQITTLSESLHKVQCANLILTEKLSFETDNGSEKMMEVTKLKTAITSLNESLMQLQQENLNLNDKLKDSDEKDDDTAELDNLKSEYQQLKKEIENVNQNCQILQEEKQKLEQTLVENSMRFQESMETTIADLNNKWEEEVNNRGDFVADTWKSHLETVEAEFGQVKNQLQTEIQELESKCNALVNENNELRKNVDAEIRNEVDKMSALQQQITNGQQRVAELTSSLQQKQSEVDAMQNRLVVLEGECERYKVELNEKSLKLANVDILIETIQKQFDEKREVVEEIVKILEKNMQWPLSFEKQDIINEFQRQIQNSSELTQQLQQSQNSLASANQAMEEKMNELVNATAAIEDYKLKLEEFKSTYMVLQNTFEEKNNQIAFLTENLRQVESVKNDNNIEVHNLEKEISEKKNELESLKKSFSETQTQLQSLTEKFNEKCLEYDRLHADFESLLQNFQLKETEYNNLQLLFDEKCRELTYSMEQHNSEISGYTQQDEANKSKLRELENYYENILLEKQNDLETLKSININIADQLDALKTENFNLETDSIAKSTQEIESLKLQISHMTQELEDVRAESASMRNLSVEVENLNQQLFEKHQYCEKLEQNIAEFNHYINEQNNKIVEQTALIDEENKQLEGLRQIIETQVAKIEELKKELYERSKDFDTVIAEMDINKKSATITQQPAATTDEIPKPTKHHEDLTEAVSRAELDLALYMLHQRDVRCEELTVELTQLLEERDTLQLRLSNAIREKEEMRRRKLGVEDTIVPQTSSSQTSSPSKSSAIFMAASGIEMGTELCEDSEGEQHLASKLSELKKVGYKKDKTFVDEQEQRRLQQMSIMQEHINEASKLPPEAAQKLVDASYTLSRDVQSPSKVLLNWLWGRSTPKVNDT